MVVATRPTFLPARIDQYTPGMVYVADAVHMQPAEFSIGTPIAADDNALLATATLDLDAGSAETKTISDLDNLFTDGELDGHYGRTIVVSPSGDPGAAVAVTVHGRDYLGQPMQETLTIANGQTGDTESKKAFKFFEKVVNAGTASNATTATLGVGSHFGVPYKFTEILYAREDNVIVKPYAQVSRLAAASLTVSGSNTATFTADTDGYVVMAEGVVTTAVTTAAATLDAQINSVGVAALDVTVPVAAAGFRFGSRYIEPVAANLVSKGQTVTFTSNGSPGAGAVILDLLIAKPYFGWQDPDTTDPATATTEDPRGLYEPWTTPNGTREFFVCLRPDNSRNSSDNGGLLGIKHYYA